MANTAAAIDEGVKTTAKEDNGEGRQRIPRIIDDGHRLYMRPTYFEKKTNKKTKKKKTRVAEAVVVWAKKKQKKTNFFYNK